MVDVRGDVKPYNQILKSFCDENNVEFIDNYNKFLFASGGMPESYFQNDKVHLNVSGTRRLLSNIDTVHSVTKTFPSSSHKRPSHGFRPNRSHLHPRDYGRRPHFGFVTKYCHICSRNDHSTQECCYNGRGIPRSGMGSW